MRARRFYKAPFGEFFNESKLCGGWLLGFYNLRRHIPRVRAERLEQT